MPSHSRDDKYLPRYHPICRKTDHFQALTSPDAITSPTREGSTRFLFLPSGSGATNKGPRLRLSPTAGSLITRIPLHSPSKPLNIVCKVYTPILFLSQEFFIRPLTVSMRSSGLTGFVRNPSMPASNAFCLSSSNAFAVSATIGTLEISTCSISRILRVAS